jgi:hypothetical protein
MNPAREQPQQDNQGTKQEPTIPEVFKSQKPGKAKIDERCSGDVSKPFCFRCYKPGHGELECRAKLYCDICASSEHLTGRCPILKQPRLMAHPCGYDVNGLGFYHIPHAPINTGKAINTSALVTVQGGVLSIPRLVAELSRLILEKWNWEVTEHEKNSFIVHFPSRGDLLRSVAFEKAHIKEHNVNLLFEEWQSEEEGFPLPRVWIHIYRLPSKLREFSVLWALGSMLGATQTIDMVTSLKKNYGRVEVAVLNVDLLPNLIDTVVIGDRLYSLPIQVEGREVNMELGTQMDVDGGADDYQASADESWGNQEQGSNGSRGKEKGEGSGQQKSQSNEPKQNSGANKEQSAGTVASHGFVADDFSTHGP